jgi:hypothetical protein
LCTNLRNGTVPASSVVSFSDSIIRGCIISRSSYLGGKTQEIVLMASLSESHAWMLRHFAAVIDASRLPAASQQTELRQLQTQAGSATALAKLLIPAYTKFHQQSRLTHARMRCGIVALALDRYRLKHKEWPADLAKITPDFLAEVPIDPFTDEPLQYRKTDNGVVVFSYGPDGDHRGHCYDPLAPMPPHWIAASCEFRLWDPVYRGKPLLERTEKNG